MTVWHWFGDPQRPRRNLFGGLLLAVLGGLQLGLSVMHGSGAGERWSWYLGVGLAVILIACGVAQFVLGLRHTRIPTNVADG